MSLKNHSAYVVYGPSNRIEGVLLARSLHDATIAAEGKWGVVNCIEEISDETLDGMVATIDVVFVVTAEYVKTIGTQAGSRLARVKRGW